MHNWHFGPPKIQLPEITMSLVRPCSFILSFLCLAASLLPSNDAWSQDKLRKKSRQKVADTPAKDAVAPGTKSSAPGKAALTNALSDAVMKQIPSVGADYIPCRFTYAELRSLTSPESVLTLSPADAEALKQSVTSAVHDQEASGEISATLQQTLLSDFGNVDLAGRTPSEALERIINSIYDAEDEEKAIIKNADLKVTIPSTAVGAEGSVTDVKESRGAAPIINAARNAVAGLVRPPDVGCAMSILSYGETTKAYGYIIGKNYIGVQVVVRNLNREQEFVLHDVEFAVDTDPGGRSGRFFSGRDKIVVRALASAEASFDPRNVIVHGAQGDRINTERARTNLRRRRW